MKIEFTEGEIIFLKFLLNDIQEALHGEHGHGFNGKVKVELTLPEVFELQSIQKKLRKL